MVFNARHRLAVLLVAMSGALVCLGALAAFVSRVLHNDLARPAPGAERQYYLEVGQAYSGGFATGFFLCFFLVLMGLVTVAYFDSRRASAQRIR